MAGFEQVPVGGCADVTRLLNRAGSGDPHAAAELLPLIYDQLRRLARGRMRHERPGQTLSATSLVHEAYLRLVNRDQVAEWEGRWHFFSAAAEAMRRILVERARKRDRLKRGGGRQRIDLGHAALHLTVHDPPAQLLALDEALDALAEAHQDKAQLVKLRYFAGLSIEQTAQALGISVATANRWWAYAKAWLLREMRSAGDGKRESSDEHS